MTKYRVEIDEKKKFTIDFDDLPIDETQLDKLLCDQPGTHGRYGRITALAKAKVERVDSALEELEAQLYLKIRKKKDSGEEKLTEPMIKAMIVTDSTRLALVNKLMEAKEQFEVALAAKEASAHKKDCLISIGANRRAEYDSELRIKERKQKS